ncbi:MAG TPA: site-2 protease family protein [Candidatus Binataceae bacterium]|nr:site-2 protease family protein [Candidatus Binataceae bacterium]
MRNPAEFLTEVSIWALPTIFAIILHEVMHGYVARMLGDNTAQEAGRLTLNPIAHIDLFGTIILPAVLLFMNLPVFGYAKPVPVDFRRLRNPRSGMIEVAAAGPLTNIALATASAVAMRFLLPWAQQGAVPPYVGSFLIYTLQASVIINVALAVFNLFPILPLDGGRVMVGMLPYPVARQFVRLEPYGFLILFVLLYTDTFQRVINPVINAIAGALL